MPRPPFDQGRRRQRRRLDVTVNETLMLYGLYKQATLGDAPKKQRVFWTKKHVCFWNQISTTLSDDDLEEALDHMDQALAILQRRMHPDNNSNTQHLATTTTTTKKTKQESWAAPVALQHSRTANTQDTMPPEEMLLLAASEDDFDTVSKLLEQGTIRDLDYRDDQHQHQHQGGGQTALHVAADRGYLRIVRLLLDHGGVDIDATDNEGISVLQAAVIGGHVDVCQELLKRGANPDLPDHDGDTARLCAMDDGSGTLRDLFDRYNTDPNHDAEYHANYYCLEDDHDDDGPQEQQQQQQQQQHTCPTKNNNSSSQGGDDYTWHTNFPDCEYNNHALPLVDCVPSSFPAAKG